MALEGTIKEFGLADIFQLIGLQKKTGTLFLKGPDGTVNISFEDGMVVKTEDSQMTTRYHTGRILINRTKITQQQLNEALEIQKSTAQRLGYVLIGQGLVNREDLAEALSFQMRETIYKVFRWRGGDYKFYQDKVDYERELIRPISSEHILMDGIRMLDEWPLLEKKLPPQDLVLKPSDRVMASELEEAETESADIFSTDEAAHKPGVSKEALTIFRLVDGRKSVVELMELSPIGSFDTSKAIVELMDKGYVLKTDTRPLALAREETIVEPTRKAEPRFYLLPYVFVAVAVILILFQVTGTRKIMSARSEGLLALKAPFAVNHIEKVYENTLVYFMDFGKYPDSPRTLLELDYIYDSDTRDPWGDQLAIAVYPSGEVEVASAGPDRLLNTSDDLTNRP